MSITIFIMHMRLLYNGSYANVQVYDGRRLVSEKKHNLPINKQRVNKYAMFELLLSILSASFVWPFQTIWNSGYKLFEKASEYDQEMPQSHTTDQYLAP